jgi:hypothetical protein
MVGLLSHGFVSQKRKSITDLSASDDVFVTIQSMAEEDETLSNSMFESLLTESEALMNESRKLAANSFCLPYSYV